MSKKQLFALFVCSLVPYVVGNGLLPLLPVYAAHLGAESAEAGYYLSISYLALTSGTIAAGWLSDRLQRRKALLVVAGVVGVPGFWLMGRATNVWQLTVLTASLWFMGGVGLALISILTGLFAEESERGKVFGILSLTGALGTMIGGLITGPIADRWGYPTMFAALSFFVILWPLSALLVEDKVVARVRPGEASTARESPGMGGGFFLLLLASLTVAASYFVRQLGLSLAMNDLGFIATAISSTGAIGGAFALPLPPLIGWLSDRVERKRLLALSYLTGTVGLLILAASASLWHFWVVASLMTVFISVSGAVGSALVTDLVPQEALGKGMSLFNAAIWVGGIIGFAGAGYAIQNLSTISTFIIGAALPLIAIALLIPIRQAGGGKGSASPHQKNRVFDRIRIIDDN